MAGGTSVFHQRLQWRAPRKGTPLEPIEEEETVSKPSIKHIDHTAQPYTGPVTFDVSSIATILVHLAAGGARGLQREKPGMDAVVAELASAMPGAGKTAGVSPDTYQAFLDITGKLARLDQYAQAIALIAQVFVDSQAWLEDQREQLLGQITDTVQSTAKRKKNDAIAKPFLLAIEYKKQSATKAVRTRKKNADAKAAAAAPATPASGAAKGAPAQGAAAQGAASATPAASPAPVTTGAAQKATAA